MHEETDTVQLILLFKHEKSPLSIEWCSTFFVHLQSPHPDVRVYSTGFQLDDWNKVCGEHKVKKDFFILPHKISCILIKSYQLVDVLNLTLQDIDNIL